MYHTLHVMYKHASIYFFQTLHEMLNEMLNELLKSTKMYTFHEKLNELLKSIKISNIT